MKKYFRDNDYFTPSHVKHYAGDILFFKTRVYFYLLLVKRIVLSSIFKARRGLYNHAFWAESSFNTLKDLEKCGIKFNISGLNYIRETEGPVVFVANHMSNLETFILPSIILPEKPLVFVIKESLRKSPFFGEIMKATSAISVGRKNPKKDLKTVLTEGEKILKDGISIAIFPQSTRHSYFDKKKFNSLGIKVAKRAGVPVIPLALKTDCLENGKIIKDFGKLNREKIVYFKFGPAVKIEGNGKFEHEKIVEFISSSLKEWGVELI